MACDVCGKTGTTLNFLLDSYQTEDIKAICPECEVVINKHKWALQNTTSRILSCWLKRFIRNLKETK